MTATTTPSVGNPMFVHNLRALWRNDARLAMRVDAIADDERFALEPARVAGYTARVVAESGPSTYLHSRHDPIAEGRQLAASIELDDHYCVVVSGIGLGYHVAALFERLSSEAIVVCVEPSLRLLSTALSCVDLAPFIEARRLVFLTEADKARVHERLQPYSTLIMLGTQFLSHAPSVRLAREASAAIQGLIAEFVTFTRMTLTTLVANSRITCRNIAMNLGTYVSTPPIDPLRDRFHGNPAVVVSAGPSLRKNIDRLASLKGKAVLIAVQTAVKPLLARGIVPDFVTSLDFHEISRKFFEGVEGLERCHLIAEPKATWHVVDSFPGMVSLLDNAWARLVLGDDLGARGGLPAGATVSHLAFYLAHYLGCDPVILVGQDLAFTNHVFYVPGVEVHQSWASELNRFQTIEQKEWERIARNRPILRKVRGVHGEELYTDELLFTYLEQFEKDIAAVPVTVINATEGGADIAGTQCMTLAEAAERFCGRPVDPGHLAYQAQPSDRDRRRIPAACAQVEARLSELDDVVGLCEELLVLLEELKSLTHDPPRFNQRLVRVDELRTSVQQHSRAYQLVAAATQLAELRRFRADRRIQASEAEGVERARRQLARDVEFISAVRDGARELTPILRDALERIRAPGESP